MLNWLRKLGSRLVSAGAVARGRLLVVRGKYDAAQTTHENRRHWANADHLSADASASAEVRRVLRSRARYEVANNSYAKGIVLTLANYVVGTGPRLQMLTDDPEANRLIEKEFSLWAQIDILKSAPAADVQADNELKVRADFDPVLHHVVEAVASFGRQAGLSPVGEFLHDVDAVLTCPLTDLLLLDGDGISW